MGHLATGECTRNGGTLRAGARVQQLRTPVGVADEGGSRPAKGVARVQRLRPASGSVRLLHSRNKARDIGANTGSLTGLVIAHHVC